MKNIRKIIIMLALVLVTALVPITAYASTYTEVPAEEKTTNNSKSSDRSGNIETDDFKIKVTCGIQGNYKYGAAVPVNIKIESKNEDFEGVVRIIVPGTDMYYSEAMAYEQEILLTAGTEKMITMSAYNSTAATYFSFQLENSKKEIIIDEKVKIGNQTNQNALVAVLSDDYTALNYFDKSKISMQTYDGDSQLIELKADDVPYHASGLECISYMIINSFDTSKLNADQLEAIREWVSQGGILIVGGGSDYKQTVSGLTDWFPVKECVSRADEFVVKGGTELEGELLTFEADGSLVIPEVEGAIALAEVISNNELIKDFEYKNGHVIFVGFNLGMEPFASWKDNHMFARNILSKSAKGYSAMKISNLNYGANADLWSIRNALEGLIDDKYPNVVVIVIILLIFILFAPVFYFVLKKTDKREYMWGLIPILSVIFTVIIFIANANIRIKHPIVTSMTTLFEEENEGESATSASVNLGVMVPGTKHTELTIGKDLANIRTYSENADYYDGSSQPKWNNDYTTSIRQTSDGHLLGFDNLSTFQTKYYSFDYVGKSDVENGLETKFTRTIAGVSGSVTNNTQMDLTEVCVIVYGKAVCLGDIKAGQTVSFAESDNIPFFDGDIYSLRFKNVSDTPEQYMEYNQLVSTYGSTYQLYISSEIEMNRAAVFTMGYIKNWSGDYIDDSKVVEYNRGVYVKKNEVGYSDYEDAEIDSLFRFAKASDAWDMFDGQLYKASADAEFDLSMNFNHIYALIRAKDSERKYGETKSTKIFAYNFKTGDYDEIFKNDIMEKFDKECPYLNEDGIMKLRFEANLTGNEYAPFITVIGGLD